MTRRSLDSMWFDGEKWTICDWTHWLGFDSEQFGVHDQYWSTSRIGGPAEFEIVDGCLRLRNFSTWNSEGEYPPINGHDPVLPSGKYDDCCWYGLELPIAYSGMLVVGLPDERSESYWVPDGRPPVYEFGVLRGIELCCGRMLSSFDLTDVVLEMRRRYDGATEDRASEITDMCSHKFGFMADVCDRRRVLIDSYFEDGFRAECEGVLDVLDGRCSAGEARNPIPGCWSVSYVPLGCVPLRIGRSRVQAAVSRLVDGRMVRGDVERFAYLIGCCSRHETPHMEFSFEVNRSASEEMEFLLWKELGNADCDDFDDVSYWLPTCGIRLWELAVVAFGLQ